MRQRIYTALIGALALSGCGQSPEAAMLETCSSVMVGPEITGDIAEAGITPAQFCECATTTLLALPETERVKAIASFELISATMQAQGVDTEKAFEAIRDASRADGATPDKVTAYQDLGRLGDQLDDLLDGIKDADGSCPA